MVNEVVWFLPPFLGFILVIIGFMYQQYTAGVMGGLTLFLFGTFVFFSNVPGLSENINLLIASVCWGYGGWILLMSSIKRVQIEFGSEG